MNSKKAACALIAITYVGAFMLGIFVLAHRQGCVNEKVDVLSQGLQKMREDFDGCIGERLGALTKEVMKGQRVVFSPTAEFDAKFAEVLGAKLDVVGRGTKDAAEACIKVDAFLRMGDITNAKLYCLNAINHDPGNVAYYVKYFDVLFKTDESMPEQEELERFQNILTTGIYQVRVEEIEQIKELLSKVECCLSLKEEKYAAVQKEDNMRFFAEAIGEAKSGRLSQRAILQNANVEECLSLLAERYMMLEKLLELDVGSADEKTWVRDEMKWTESLKAFRQQTVPIQTYLDRAAELLNADGAKLGAASVAVQSASQMLSQLICMDTSLLPQGASNVIQSLAQRIEDLEAKFNMIKSQPALDKIKDCDNDSGKEYKTKESLIVDLGIRIEQIAQQLPFVYDVKSREAVECRLKELSQQVSAARDSQRMEYQKWAIAQCDLAFKKYKSWKRVDEVDALSVIRTYMIDIDFTLLVPDVQRLYQDVLNKQFAELGADTLVKIELEMAKSKKKTLKDF